MLRATIAAIVLSSTTSPASAEGPDIYTGNGLYRVCSEESPGFQSGLCHGFIAGVIARSSLAERIVPKSGLICDVSRAENGQIRDVIVAYLRDHPADRHYASSQLIVQALQAAFCTK